MNSEDLKKYKSICQKIDKYPQIKNFLRGNDSIEQLFELSLPVDPKRKAHYKSLYDGVGDTNCYTLNLPNNNLLHVKLECSNPMGNSHYSRYWIPHLYIAEAMGIIEPNQTHILEVSSGSSGIALAIACNKLGYELSIIVPREIPTPRVLPMKKHGAHVIQEENYISGCIRKLRSMLSSRQYYCPNHSEEKTDLITHIFRRIIVEHHKKNWLPDYAILGIGNGTTTQAIFEYLNSCDKRIECYSYHPIPNGKHLIFGLYAQNVELRHVQQAMNISDKIYTFEEIDIQKIRELFTYDTEISNLGDSSLIGLHYALLVSEKVNGKNFFTLGYDKNDRY